MPKVPAGYKMKFTDVPFISELKARGYDYKNLPAILETSPKNYIKLFQEPERFTYRQFIILSHLLLKPIPEIINTLIKTPIESPHYLREDYNAHHHVKQIKAELIAKEIIKPDLI